MVYNHQQEAHIAAMIYVQDFMFIMSNRTNITTAKEHQIM